jgi:phospholipid/cholesterol/gamma-HCH transport system permease protein
MSRPLPPPLLDAEHASSLIARLGHAFMVLCHDFGGTLLLALSSLRLLLKGRVDGRETLRHTERFALRPLPLVLGGSIIVGGVVAMQGLGYISRYNATDVYGWASGVSSFREVAPMLLGLTLASRVGAKNTAELASMVAKERLDALSALGLDVVQVVIAPRAIAITLAAVLLYPLATTTVLLSSFLLARAIGDQHLFASWASLVEYMPASVVLEGFARMTAFGALIGTTTVYFGTRGGRDARAIGRAVYAASVASVAGIVGLNLYLTFLGGA